MKTLRVALAVVAVAVGLNYAARYFTRSQEPTIIQAGALGPMLPMVAEAAKGNLFYSPNQGAMQIGAGVCINATNLDGGQGPCLYTITVDSSGNLAYYCNAAAGASCFSSLNGAMASSTRPQFLCDGGLCPVFDAGY